MVLHAEGLSKAYDRPLFHDLTFDLPRGRRLGIMGPNGSGKTTLLRVLLGEEEPDSGVVQRGHLTELGYYDQQLKTLPADKPVIRAVWPGDDPDAAEQTMRDLLGRFGLTGDQVYQVVGQLSGGEKSRAALAKLVAQGVNVLILDEPTNHLDLWACDALEQALLEFDGTVLVVSHDRYFLNRVIDLLLVLDGRGETQVIHGNYDTYELMRAQQDAAASSRERERPEKAPAGRGRPSPEARRRRRSGSGNSPTARRRTSRRTSHRRRRRCGRWTERRLASPELYRDGEKVKQTTKAFEEVKAHLAQLYEHWEEAVEMN